MITKLTTRRSPGQRVHSLDPETQLKVDVLSRHAQNPSAFLALNRDTRRFSVPGVDGFIAYRPAGRRFLVQFGGVFAAEPDRSVLLREFLDFGAEHRRRVIAVQLMSADAELLGAFGFSVNQFGTDFARRLAGFSISGKKYVQLRNKLSRAKRADITVVEIDADECGSIGLAEQLAVVDHAWLRSKGRHVREIAFMVGERGGPAGALRRTFVAFVGQDPIAYVSFSPVYGETGGWLHDLSRRVPDAPPGALELIVMTAVEKFRAEGALFLHFGFTPFVGLDPVHEKAGHSRLITRVAQFVAAHGSFVYPAASQVAYKQKWGPDLVQPEYLAFQGGASPLGLWNLLRVTNIL